MADSFDDPSLRNPFGKGKHNEGLTNPRSPFRISRPKPPPEKQMDQDRYAGDADSNSAESGSADTDSVDSGNDESQDEWNPFWGPRPAEGQPQEKSVDKEEAEELEKAENENLVRSLKGGVASIGASSEFFIPFPSQNEIIEQVHKMLKKLVNYRESWTRGNVAAHERSILHKEIMILIVSIDHYKKCRKTYFASLDIILELLTNIEKVISPNGTGVILPGTIDVYNQEVKSLFSIGESEKKVALISKLLGFLGFVLIIIGIVRPELSIYYPVICGGIMLLSSIVYQKMHFWKNYSTRP